MSATAEPMRIEPRWPVAAGIGSVLLLTALLPNRITLFPAWVVYALSGALLAPMAFVGLSRGKAVWLRIERVVLVIFLAVALIGIPATVFKLIGTMIHKPAEVGGLELLASSIAVWFTNVLAFSLMYWAFDCGGPEARVNDMGKQSDWRFPQAEDREGAATAWRPAYVDYLFLSYSTATAFSATDAAPVTSRAKLLMMLESTMSLAMIAVVAARAINILGS